VNKCRESTRELKGTESAMGRLKVRLVARRVGGVAGVVVAWQPVEDAKKIRAQGFWIKSWRFRC